MKFQDSSFNGLKVTVGTKSVTHPSTHAPTHAPKAICPINFFKVGGIKRRLETHFIFRVIICFYLRTLITPLLKQITNSIMEILRNIGSLYY